MYLNMQLQIELMYSISMLDQWANSSFETSKLKHVISDSLSPGDDA